MSGIQIHSQDPITATKATGITPQTAYKPSSTKSEQPAVTTTAATHNYAPPMPGAAVPTPTNSKTLSTNNGPSPPQPGAVPVPRSPMTTAKPSLPPPPKAGEKPQPSQYYTPTPTQPAQPQPYPHQMSQPPLGSMPNGIPPASTTSTTTASSFPSERPPTSLPVSVASPARTSLEHPPGYVQDPYASEMTSNQRLTAEHEENESHSETLPSLGYRDSVKRNSNGEVGDDQSIFEAAMKWGKEKGRQLGDLHEQVWDSVGRK